MKVKAAPLQAEYARLRARLARQGWISQGYEDRSRARVALVTSGRVKSKARRCR